MYLSMYFYVPGRPFNFFQTGSYSATNWYSLRTKKRASFRLINHIYNVYANSVKMVTIKFFKQYTTDIVYLLTFDSLLNTITNIVKWSSAVCLHVEMANLDVKDYMVWA